MNIRLGNASEAVGWFQKTRQIAGQRIQSFGDLIQESSIHDRLPMISDLKDFAQSPTEKKILEMSSGTMDYGRSLAFVESVARLVESSKSTPNARREIALPGSDIVARIQSSLTSTQAVVGFLNTQDELDILFITHDRLGWKKEDVSRRLITKEIGELYNSASSPLKVIDAKRETEELDPNRFLFETMLGPIVEVIKDKFELTIVTDGELCSVPFEMLRDKSGRRLVQDHVVNYELSLEDIAKKVSHYDPKRRAILFLGVEDND